MPSLKSQWVNWMMRNRHLFQGKLRRTVFNENTSITDFRELCEKGGGKVKVPEGIAVEKDTVAGIHSEWLIPGGADHETLIFYVHGGGYVSGSCNDHRGIVGKFTRQSGVRTLLFEYRLAPEHPFPAGLNDAVAVYQEVLERGVEPKRIIFAGESAGGGMVLALLLALKERGLAQPAGAVAISPWTDLTCSSHSYRTKSKVSVAPKDSWKVFSKHYVGDQAAELPLISPLFGNLQGLPPLLINAGQDDELFDDGQTFALKAQGAGVEVTFRAGEGMVHCYPLLAPMFKEATEAMEEICTFISQQLGRL